MARLEAVTADAVRALADALDVAGLQFMIAGPPEVVRPAIAAVGLDAARIVRLGDLRAQKTAAKPLSAGEVASVSLDETSSAPSASGAALVRLRLRVRAHTASDVQSATYELPRVDRSGRGAPRSRWGRPRSAR